MNRILNHLTRLLAWLNEIDQPSPLQLSSADWADLPTYHAPAPRS
jgi:hypothetical protein